MILENYAKLCNTCMNRRGWGRAGWAGVALGTQKINMDTDGDNVKTETHITKQFHENMKKLCLNILF